MLYKNCIACRCNVCLYMCRSDRMSLAKEDCVFLYAVLWGLGRRQMMWLLIIWSFGTTRTTERTTFSSFVSLRFLMLSVCKTHRRKNFGRLWGTQHETIVKPASWYSYPASRSTTKSFSSPASHLLPCFYCCISSRSSLYSIWMGLLSFSPLFRVCYVYWRAENQETHVTGREADFSFLWGEVYILCILCE